MHPALSRSGTVPDDKFVISFQGLGRALPGCLLLIFFVRLVLNLIAFLFFLFFLLFIKYGCNACLVVYLGVFAFHVGIDHCLILRTVIRDLLRQVEKLSKRLI
ncbi:hypothetical protein AcV7_002077 [Taiwanofungus camphoratus]|nr:hypothetical protein AcV7_002077 [Antrodia cinnamomea]